MLASNVASSVSSSNLKLIEKYIKQIGDLSGVEYEVEWELEELSK